MGIFNSYVSLPESSPQFVVSNFHLHHSGCGILYICKNKYSYSPFIPHDIIICIFYRDKL